MKKESIQAYSTRITQANQSELVVITYEIILEHIKDAQEAFQNQDMILYSSALESAQGFLKELMVALDFKYEISRNLMSIYIFINKVLIEAKMKKNPELLPRIEKILKNLLSSFQETAKQDHSRPVMENTTKVYAGLTYGRNSLNETMVDDTMKSRGFRV